MILELFPLIASAMAVLCFLALEAAPIKGSKGSRGFRGFEPGQRDRCIAKDAGTAVAGARGYREIELMALPFATKSVGKADHLSMS
jgi:hypothetical protein